MSLVAMVRRANVKGPPEESLILRGTVLVAVLTAGHAVIREQVGGPVLAAGVLVGIPTGFAFSHWARRRSGLFVKLMLALGMIAAVVHFVVSIGGVGHNIAAAQRPLAELFLWTQLLHAFDVPGRRDLAFSLVSSLALIGVAGTLSISLLYGMNLAVWTIAALAAAVVMHGRELVELPRPSNVLERRRAARPWVAVGGALVTVALAGGVVFAVVPAAGGARALTFPVSLPEIKTEARPGALANPSLGRDDPAGPSRAGQSGSGDRTSFGYFGFSKTLDTSVRGRPDDSIVMRVRADAPAFWRGQSFDSWDGRTWASTLPEAVPLPGRSPIEVPVVSADSGALGNDDFVQTYFVERQGPNILFAASSATQLYVADSTIYRLADGSLRSSVVLDKGAVYTVVSRRPSVNVDQLRALPRTNRDGLTDSQRRLYTELPLSTPTRVRALAEEVTATEVAEIDKVQALEAWMAANTRYSLDIAPLPAGVDSVDHFLFDERVGFCEQIGSSLVVMARSLGIPARLTVGYVSGERNPFTGLFEVKASDAHAWAEIYFPNVGWLPFDPTANVPFAADATAPRAGAGDGAWKFVSSHLPSVPSWAVTALLAVGMFVAIAGLFVVARSLRLWWRRRKARTWLDRWVAKLDRLGSRGNRVRRPSESVRSYVAALGLDGDEWRRAVAVVEADAFARTDPGDEARAHADGVVDNADRLLGSSIRTPTG